MIRRKRPISLTDYRSVMHSDGDIAVGAYARAQRRRRVFVGFAGLALIAGAVCLHLALRPKTEVAVAGAAPVLVQCVVEKCGYRGVVYLRPGEGRFPMVCPKCGQRSCQKVWECRDCGAQFLRKPELETEGGILHCPRCGSERVGTAEGPVAGGGAGGIEVRALGESGR